jgi:predicted Holliday junction resolvase-like endonuclease
MVEITTIVLLVVFFIGLIIAYQFGTRIGKKKQDEYWESELPNHRRAAVMKSRAVIGGQFSEQLAPYLPDFEHLPTECKFMGKPIDFIVFKGMDEKKIEEVVFVEVKSGKAKLNAQEKNLKETIDNKKVKWVEYRIPEGLTDKKDIGEKIDEFLEDVEEE